MTVSDEQLMRQYCDGDVAAFDDLYQRYRGPLFRYVSRLATPQHDVEALYQDAWLRVVQSRDRWCRDQPFRPWLYRVVHNRVIDALRREGRHDASDDDVAALPSAHGDADAVHWLRDCVERLMALLGRLPEAQRSAFLLKEEAGLSLEQIGDVSGVGRETVKSRLRYAIARLRAGLEGCDE